MKVTPGTMHSKSSRRWTCSLAQHLYVAMAALLALLPVARADDTVATQWDLQREHWYTLKMGESGSGWMYTATHSDGKRIRTTTNMTITIARIGEASDIVMESTFLETTDGEPLEMTSRQVMSSQAMYGKWVFDDDVVHFTSRQGEREVTREVDPPEGIWLTPHEASTFIAQRLEAGAEELTYRTLAPDQGLVPVNVSSTRAGSDVHSIDDREVPVSVWKTTTSVMPIETVEHYTDDGTLVYQQTPTGLGTMSMKHVTKTEALDIKPVDAPTDMLPQTFITPDQPMKDAQRSRTATFVLRARDGELPELPEAGAQRFKHNEQRNEATLTVNIDDNLPATEAQLEDDAYRTASSMIDSEDAMIQSLTRRALRDAGLDTDDAPADRAAALRSFVHRYITNPNLAVPFASASETARTRAGDCSEFAVLLAAMLRADGIPSRTASGLVYADRFAGSQDIFGWHMWTQALLDGAWVDYDATLPVRYHAGHILAGTSSLADGKGMSDMSSMMILIGNLEIDIVDVGY